MNQPQLNSTETTKNDTCVKCADSYIQLSFYALFIFLLCGLLEIGGGWLIWQFIREQQPWYFAFSGSVLLVCYGFAATTQFFMEDFARVYAIYGAIFILLSILWGYGLDGFQPDLGDFGGAGLVIAGALLMFFWPR